MITRWSSAVSRFAVIPVLFFVVACSKESRVEGYLNRAVEFRKEGENDKARIEFLNALRLDPGNQTALRELGEIWFEEGVPLQAAPFLMDVAKSNPEDAGSRIKLARIYLTFGDRDAARKEVFDILERDATNAEAAALLINSSRTPEQHEEAKTKLAPLLGGSGADSALLNGVLSLTEDQPEAARRFFDEAVDLEPENEDALLGRASVLEALGESDAAKADLEKAVAIAGPRSGAVLRLAEFQTLHGDAAGARARLEDVIAGSPSFTAARILLARQETKDGDFPEALAQLKEVFSRDPSNLDGRLLESEILVQQGKSEKAVETLKSLRDAYPNFPAVHFYLGRAYLLTANPSVARKSLEEALKLNPGYVEARIVLGELDLRDGKPEETARSMSELLKQVPNLFPAQTLLAQSYRALGRYEDAAAVLREQIQAAPENAEPVLLLAIVLRQLGKGEEVRKLIEEATELDPRSLLGLSLSVELDLQDGKVGEAIERIKAFRDLMPESAASYLIEGRILMLTQKWQDAEPLLRKAIELDPDLTEGYELLVSGYVANNDLEQAAAKVSEYLDRNPEKVQPRVLLGIIRERQGQPEKAMEVYRQVLKAEPDSTTALNNLAWLCAQDDALLGEAREYASKARGLKPEDPFIADTLGWIHYRRGEFRDALRRIREAAEKAPDQPEIKYHLAQANYMMGNEEAAIQAMKEALAGKGEFASRTLAEATLADWEAGSTVEGIEDLETLSTDHPSDPIVRLRLGEAYANAGRTDDAVAALGASLEINPDLTTASLKLAELEAEALNDPAAAMKTLLAARESDPDDLQLRIQLGKAAYTLGNYQWAYSLLKPSGGDELDAPEMAVDFARSAYAVGRISEARETMSAATANTSLDESIRKGADEFVTLAAIDAPDSARESTVSPDGISPDSPNALPARYVAALAAEASGDQEKATQSFEAILKDYPDFVPASRELAVVYSKNPDSLDKAYELAIRARKSLQSDLRLTRVLGEISYKRKDYRFASQLFEECSRSGENDPELQFLHGMSLAETEQPQKAREQLEAAIKGGLKPQLAAEAKQKIAELDGEGNH